MIRVFLADDHDIIRQGLARILEEAPDMECAGEASSGEGLFAELGKSPWDVVILDMSLPGGGEEILSRLQSLRPQIKVIIFSMYPEDQYAIRLLKQGASAYLNKGRPTQELLAAIRKVASGGRYITQEIAMQLLENKANEEEAGHEQLSPREHQIFMLLLDSKQPNEISEELCVSPSTISTHIQSIKRKLGVRTVVDMVKYAYRTGMIH